MVMQLSNPHNKNKEIILQWSINIKTSHMPVIANSNQGADLTELCDWSDQITSKPQSYRGIWPALETLDHTMVRSSVSAEQFV